MIQHIKIENYKSIPSLELDLGRVNVLVGENGCGKTNILEAVALGSAVVEDNLAGDGYLTAKGIRVSESNLMFSGFEKTELSNRIRVEFKNEATTFPLSIIHIYDPGNYWLSERMEYATKEEAAKIWSESKGDLMTAFEKGRGNYLKKIRQTNISSFLLYAPENTHLRRFDDEGQIRPLGIRGEGLFSHLADLTRKEPTVFQKINETLQLIDWFGDFEIPNDLIFNERRIRIRDRYLDEGIQYIDQRSSNEGFLYLLFTLLCSSAPTHPSSSPSTTSTTRSIPVCVPNSSKCLFG